MTTSSPIEPPSNCAVGGPARKVGRQLAQCPGCGYTFVTLMDEPILPPHETTDEWIKFGWPGDAAQRSDRR